MTHLTPDELVDAAEGTLDGSRLRHVDECESCRRELDALTGVMRAAAPVQLPEPSPLFWEHFSARVRAAIEAEGTRRERPAWHGWLGWRTLVPIGAVAALLIVFAASVPLMQIGRPNNMSGAPEWPDADLAVPDVPTDDTEWGALAEMVGPLDWEAAGEAGLTLAPGDADAAVLDLSDDERRELSRLVATEWLRLKS